MTWTITDRFPTWGENGELPPDGFFYSGGDQVNEKHLDALWNNVREFETETRSALTDIDADGDGIVDGADQSDSLTASANTQGDVVASDGTTTIWDDTNAYIPQGRLQNDSVTVNATGPLTGGGTVALGNSVSLDANIPVDSVHGRTGAVTAQSGDYSHSQIGNVLSDDHHSRYTDLEASSAAPVQDVNGQTGNVNLNYNDVGALADHEYTPEADTHSKPTSVNTSVGSLSTVLQLATDQDTNETKSTTINSDLAIVHGNVDGDWDQATIDINGTEYRALTDNVDDSDSLMAADGDTVTAYLNGNAQPASFDISIRNINFSI